MPRDAAGEPIADPTWLQNAVFHVRVLVDGVQVAMLGAATQDDLAVLLRMIACVYSRESERKVRIQVWDYARDNWWDPIGKRSWPAWDGFVDVSLTVHLGSANL